MRQHLGRPEERWAGRVRSWELGTGEAQCASAGLLRWATAAGRGLRLLGLGLWGWERQTSAGVNWTFISGA